jgi:hypothetical protein
MKMRIKFCRKAKILANKETKRDSVFRQNRQKANFLSQINALQLFYMANIACQICDLVKLNHQSNPSSTPHYTELSLYVFENKFVGSVELFEFSI